MIAHLGIKFLATSSSHYLGGCMEGSTIIFINLLLMVIEFLEREDLVIGIGDETGNNT
jgi:hypothetical protein